MALNTLAHPGLIFKQFLLWLEKGGFASLCFARGDLLNASCSKYKEFIDKNRLSFIY
jgi:hypothetical protein